MWNFLDVKSESFYPTKNHTKLLNGQETCFCTQTQGHFIFCQVIVHVAKPIPTCELFHVLFIMMKLEGNVQVCKRKKNNVFARVRRNRCMEKRKKKCYVQILKQTHALGTL
jgi:hypothetical protein